MGSGRPLQGRISVVLAGGRKTAGHFFGRQLGAGVGEEALICAQDRRRDLSVCHAVDRTGELLDGLQMLEASVLVGEPRRACRAHDHEPVRGARYRRLYSISVEVLPQPASAATLPVGSKLPAATDSASHFKALMPARGL